MSSTVLADRDTNAQPAATAANDSQKPKSMAYHRQVLENKLKEGSAQQNYISPSDNIQSPATQKLNAFKSKQMSKAKPRTLFAKATSNAPKSLSETTQTGTKETSEFA